MYYSYYTINNQCIVGMYMTYATPVTHCLQNKRITGTIEQTQIQG